MDSDYLNSVKEAAKARKRTIYAWRESNGTHRSTINLSMVPFNVAYSVVRADGSVTEQVGGYYSGS